jgi:hypothetical protein
MTAQRQQDSQPHMQPMAPFSRKIPWRLRVVAGIIAVAALVVTGAVALAFYHAVRAVILRG